jgi:hypothetical protein
VLIEGSAGPVVVVVVEVGPQDAFEMASVDDQESVEALAAKGADETLHDRVRLRRPSRRATIRMSPLRKRPGFRGGGMGAFKERAPVKRPGSRAGTGCRR